MTDRVFQPKTEIYRLEELDRAVRSGQVRVPHFQRSFRWDGRDVLLLFDSILKGYPVGSVLLWKRHAKAAALRLGALEIDAAERSDGLWVVDGQQRITALVNGVSQEAYDASELFRLDYDLAKEKVLRSADADPQMSIPLPVLFDLRRFLEWIQSRPDVQDRATQLNDVAAILREFTLPASTVLQDDGKVLQDIFDRMNNTGRRLRRAEVFQALYAPEEDDRGALNIDVIAEQIADETGFGLIDQDTVLHAILARRHADVTRDVRREFDRDSRDATDFPGEDRAAAYAAGRRALLLAVEFLQRTAGVPHFSFLPYRYQLIALARFFAHFPQPRPRNRELLSQWFWRASLAPGAFRGSATGMVRGFTSRIHAGAETDSVRALLATVEDESRLSWPQLARFRTNEAATRVMLCAMYDSVPRMFGDGQALDIGAIADSVGNAPTAFDLVGEIIPRRLLKPPLSYSAANRFLLSSDDPVEPARRILAGEVPEGLAATVAAEIRSSHLVSDEAAAELAGGGHEEFLRLRTQSLQSRVDRFLQVRMGFGYEATPPLIDLDLDDDGPRDDSDAA